MWHDMDLSMEKRILEHEKQVEADRVARLLPLDDTASEGEDEEEEDPPVVRVTEPPPKVGKQLAVKKVRHFV